MKYLVGVLLVSLLLIINKLDAQERILESFEASEYIQGAQLVRLNSQGDLPSYVQFEESGHKTVEEFFPFLERELSLKKGYSFRKKSERKDQLGQRHLRYVQYYNNVELSYSNLMVHVLNRKVISFNGVFFNSEISELKNGLTEGQAFKKALDAIDADEYYWELNNGYALPEVKSTYLPHGLISSKENIVPCFKVNIYAMEPLSRNLVFVNAETGEIEFMENLLHTGNSPAQAVTAYSDTQNIFTDSINSAFRLRDSTRGNGVETYNCQTGQVYANAVDFIDTNNFWDNFNPQLDEYATDAQWGTARTYDYLKDVHSYNSINDSGFTLKSYIHYRANYVNAFWDGQRMTYGDGDQNTTPLVTLDVVGHEVAHGLTEFSAGLIYANESGALNESFSDIFGTAVEFFARPTRANWTIGEDIGGAFRSMVNPNQNFDPDTYGGQYWVDQNCIPTRNNDRCGVHTNSGVQNYWFYLLSEGGIGLNDNVDSFNVVGLGMNKAERIAFRNLTTYLSPSSNFEDARFYSIISAIDLFGACSPEVESTANAWHAVGVGEKYKAGVSADFSVLPDTLYCFFPAEITFKSTGSNVVNYKWDFGNGDTSLQRNPVVTYMSQGTYSIQLIGDGGLCGSDTITRANLITLDTNIACAFILKDTTNPEVNVCSGRLYDSGGAGLDYQNEERGEFTINVPAADFIELDFSDMQLERSQGFSCNKDYVEVYDGDNTNARSLGRFCSEILPPANKLLSTGNAITLKFFSDEFADSLGFLISWQCMNSTQTPNPDFAVLIDTTCTGLVPFRNSTTDGATSFLWNFGDGNTSTEKDPTHRYLNEGSYDVQLIASNSMGSDTILKTALVTVERSKKPLVQGDTVCKNGVAGLKVFSAENIEWYADTMGSRISTNDSLTFLNLQTDSTVYVREVSKNSSITGSFTRSMGAGVNSNDNDYLIFDVLKPINIETVLMSSTERGTLPLEVRNNQGEIVGQAFVPAIGRATAVNVNIILYPDTAYRMSVSHRNASLFKNTSGASYPYNIGDLVRITGSNLSSTEFPYFYEWKVKELACESNFTEVVAKVDTSCVITSLSEVSNLENVSVFPNPTSQFVNIRGLSANQSYSIQLISAIGQEVQQYKSNKLQRAHGEVQLNVSQLNSGIYYIKISTSQGIQTFKILKSD